LLDTSVWIAWFFQKHPHHLLSIDLLEARSESAPAWLCRATEQSFLRLATTAAVCRAYSSSSFTNQEATAILANWRALPHIRSLDAEPAGTRELWLELAAIPSASPKVWMDAYLAAIAIRAGLRFATLDADFRRFEPAGLDLLLLSA
jgi:toxin-antitoxin system PIN domain toxin